MRSRGKTSIPDLQTLHGLAVRAIRATAELNQTTPILALYTLRPVHIDTPPGSLAAAPL